MPRTTETIVEVDRDSLRAAEQAFEALGKKSSGRWSRPLDETAIDAQRKTGKPFETAIEGDLSKFTQIDPGSKRPAARANELGLTSSNDRFDATRTDTSKSFAEQAAKIEGEERRIVEESKADKPVLMKD